MSVTVKNLSPDQLAAYNAIIGWIRDPDRDLLSLAGFAGTGKSTLVSLVAEQVDLPAFCAYTGKAASVLRRKLNKGGTETIGAQPRKNGAMSTDERPFCGTIHSLIYRPCDCREPKTIEVLKPCPEKDCTAETLWLEDRSECKAGHVGLVKTRKAFDALEPKTKFVPVVKNADGSCKLCGGKEWLRRDVLDRDYKLIVLDEASMADDLIVRDLQSYGVPILAVGDHGQLPPVGGTGSLMKSPHLRLEKIHRQAEGNSIIALSKIIRETGRIPDTFDGGEAVRFARLRDMERIIEERYSNASAARLLEMGIACYTNRRRVGLNLMVRRARGTSRDGREFPRAGEHLVCLRNMKGEQGRPPVANGMRGVLTTDLRPKLIEDTHGEFENERGKAARESETQFVGEVEFPEDDIRAYTYEMFGPQFNREKTYSSPEELARETGIHSFSMAGALFDFGWAMTAHKCVDPNTLVETPDGLVRAGQLPPSGRIATPTGWAMYRNFVRNRRGAMLELHTADGYALRATPDHGVDVWDPSAGYVRREANQIRPGDILRLRLGAEFVRGTTTRLPNGRPQDVRAKKYKLPKSCTADVAEFFGLMVADGTVWARGFRLAKRHKDVADRFATLCRKLFGKAPSRFFKLGAHHVEINSALIADWLRDVGGMTPNSKNVPDCILASPLGVQARFLRGLFEDGTVNMKNGLLDHIEFSSTVPEVRRTVRTMLLRFGIVSGSTDHRQSSVYIYGAYAKTFGARIGFVSKFKQSRLKTRAPIGTRYTIPLLDEEEHLAPQSERLAIQRHRAPKSVLADRGGFHHSTVKSVSKYTGESCCVEVPDGHQFLQDGFCGWNCQGSGVDDLLAVVERPGPVDDDTWKRWQYTICTRAVSKLTVLR